MSSMTYIEGIGDEVLLVFGAFFILLIVAIAWLSTSVQEPRVNLIVVDRERFNQVIQRVRDAGYRIARFSGGQVLNLDRGAAVPAATEQVGTTGSEEDSERRTEVSTNDSVVAGEEINVSNTPSNEGKSGINLKQGVSETNGNNAAVTTELQEPETEIRSPQDLTDSTPHDRDVSNGQGSLLLQNGSSSIDSKRAENSESSQDKEDEEKEEGAASQEEPPPTGDNRGARATSQGSQQVPEGHIRVNLKFLDERQRIVQARPQETIGQFKRNHFAGELAQNLVVRLIYNGREMRPDNLPLQAYNIRDRSIIHCILRDAGPTSPSNEPVELEEEDLNLGTYIFPLFGIILGLIWYSRFAYGKYFNVISTVALIGITFLYVVVLLASLRNSEDHNNIVEVHEHQD